MSINKSIIIFMFLNFVISFMSDIILNDLSTNFNVVTSLKSYFYKHSIIKSAFDAGMTILFALVITMFFSYLLFGFVMPNNFTNLISSHVDKVSPKRYPAQVNVCRETQCVSKDHQCIQ